MVVDGPASTLTLIRRSHSPVLHSISSWTLVRSYVSVLVLYPYRTMKVVRDYVRELLFMRALFMVYSWVTSWSHLQCSDQFFVRAGISIRASLLSQGSLVSLLTCHLFLFPTNCTHSYVLGTTCTQSHVWFLLVRRFFQLHAYTSGFCSTRAFTVSSSKPFIIYFMESFKTK